MPDIVPGQCVAFQLAAEVKPEQMPLLCLRGPMLVRAAVRLGIEKGCRVQDDATGFDFRWRPA